MDLYRDIILDHYKHPHNMGHLDKPDGSAEAYNTTCGDKIRMEVVTDKKTQILKDIRFSGTGCAISQAAASMLTDKVKQMSIARIGKLGTHDMLELIGSTLTPSRIKCATLPLEVLQKALMSK
jgi:nitrogen fixation protein NifU and related proteins